MRYSVLSFIRHHSIELISTVFLFLLCAVATISLWRQTHTQPDIAIALQINDLANAFKKMDTDCEILSFAHSINYVDFLNVTSFSGSEVGSITVKYPHKWAGPYWHDVPTVQMRPYEVIQTHKGYFLVPGRGVKLGNGKIIGKDLVLTETSDIPALMERPDGLQIGPGNAAAVRLDIKLNRTLDPIFETDMLLAFTKIADYDQLF